MKKISVMDEENKNIEIYDVSYNQDEIVEYINSIKSINSAVINENIHVSNYEKTSLTNTEQLKEYLKSLLDQKVINLEEINKLVKSNSLIRSVETMVIIKEFMNLLNFELTFKAQAGEAQNLVRKFMIFDGEVSEEEIETLVVSAAINNREAFRNIGFTINNEKNKTR